MKKYLPLLILPVTLLSFHLFATDEPLIASVVAVEDYTRANALDDMQAIADRLEKSSNDLLEVAKKINELSQNITTTNQ